MKRLTGKMCILFLCFSVFIPRMSYAAEKPTRTYRFAARLSASGGLGPGQLYDMIKIVTNKLKAETGINIEFISVNSYDESIELLSRKRIDFGYMSEEQYVEFEKRGFKLLPVLTYAINRESMDALCIWARKNDAPKIIDDIVGKKYITSRFNQDHDIKLRNYLKDNGVDKPLWEIFSDFTKSANANSSFIAIGLGKGDIVMETLDYETGMKFLNPTILKKVGLYFCSKRMYNRPFVVANTATIKKDDLNKVLEILRDYMTHPEKYEEMKAYAQLLKKSHVSILVGPNLDFTAYKKLDAEATKNGWRYEAAYIENFMKDIPPGQAVKIPPPKWDYAKCKAKCGKNKKYDACMDACMR